MIQSSYKLCRFPLGSVQVYCCASLLFAIAFLGGCSNEIPYFRANLVEIEIEQDADEPVTEDQQQVIAETLLALFGSRTPPSIHFPAIQKLWRRRVHWKVLGSMLRN